jgi:hypothetical protein
MVRLVEAGSANTFDVPANGWISVRVSGRHQVEVIPAGASGARSVSSAARDGSFRVPMESLEAHANVIVKPVGGSQFAADTVLSVRVAPATSPVSIDVDDVRPGGLRSVVVVSLEPLAGHQRVRVERVVPAAGLSEPTVKTHAVPSSTSVEAMASSVARQRASEGSRIAGTCELVVDGSVSVRTWPHGVDLLSRLLATALEVEPRIVLASARTVGADGPDVRDAHVGVALSGGAEAARRVPTTRRRVFVTDLPPSSPGADTKAVVVAEPAVTGVLEPAGECLVIGPDEVRRLQASVDDGETMALVERIIDFVAADENGSDR